jgi:AraC-like DNA-binding protein
MKTDMTHKNNLPMRTGRLFLTALIAAAMTATFAQQQQEQQQQHPQSQVDSIAALLPQMQGDEKLKTLRTLSDMTDNLPEQKQYIESWLNEARRRKNVEDEGDALFSLSTFYYYRFDTDTFFVVTDEAIRFARQHQLYETLFILHQNLIQRYQVQGRTLTAILKTEEAYAEAKALQDNTFMARILVSMGEIYHETGQNREAMRCFSEAIELANQKREQDTYFFINTYYCLASISGYLHRFDDALLYADSMHTEVNRLRQNNPDVNLQLYDFLVEAHRVQAYARLGQIERAHQAKNQAEALFDPRRKETSNEIFLYEMNIEYYMATGDYDKALEHIRHTKRFYEDRQLGNLALQKKTEEAKALSGKGEYRTATGLYQQIIAEKDSLHSESIHTHLNELRAIYELDKAELEAERRRETIRRQRLYIIGSTGACIALAVIVVLIAWSRKRIHEKNRGLYRQLKEQYLFEKQLDRERAENRKLRRLVNAENAENVPKKSADEELFEQLNFLMKEERLVTESKLKSSEAAEKIELSDRGLHDKKKKMTGTGFAEYVNGFRLSYANELLLSENEKLTIEAIAKNAGFKTRETFHRYYREKYGISPGEVVKNQKADR